MTKPEVTFRQGVCQASVFVNEINKGGRQFEIKSVSFQKRYKDSNGQWPSISKLDINDIPKAILCLGKAYNYLTSKEVDDKVGGEDK